jgi:hypothetical protein
MAHVRPPHTFGTPWHQGMYPIIENISVKYLYQEVIAFSYHQLLQITCQSSAS